MKTSFARKQKQLLGPGPCTPALGADPFSTAMGTRQDQSHKNPPKRCRKQQPSFRLPPNPILHSRVKALKVGSSLTPAQTLPSTRTPTLQLPSGLCQGLGCSREGTTPIPQPSLLLPTFSFPCCCLSCFPAQHFPFLPLHSPGRGTALELGAASMADGSGKKPFSSPGAPQAQQDGWDEAQAT